MNTEREWLEGLRYEDKFSDDRPSEAEIEGYHQLDEHGLDWDPTATICPMTDEPCRDPRCYESGCEAEREEELG